MHILIAYLVSTLGGAVLVGLVVGLMHRTAGDRARPKFHPLHLWVGITERMIATTLLIWTPKLLPVFIGGWVVAKIAAGWGRRTDEHATNGQFISLVGNAFSFAIAILAGVLAHPQSLAAINAAP